MMTVSVPIDRKLCENVSVVQLDPSEVRLLGSSDNAYGKFSVVLLMGSPGQRNGHVEFEQRHAHVLNIGTSSQALVIFGAETEASRQTTRPRPQDDSLSVSSEGDQAFLNELPGELRAIGSALLRSVRRHYPGALRLFPKSGRYVESPDNFWTVKIQPRDGSLRITVRGIPEDFKVPAGIDLKPDQRVYSNFKIWRHDQVEAALSIIRQARKK